MVLNVDLNEPAPIEYDSLPNDSVTGNTSNNSELGSGLARNSDFVQVDKEVIICSPRSFSELYFCAQQRFVEAMVKSHGNHWILNGRAESLANNTAGSSCGEIWYRRGQIKQMIGNEKLVMQLANEAKVLPAAVPQPQAPVALTCPICMGPIVEETSTKCGHIFCKACINSAMEFRKKCPTCRHKLTTKDIFRIFLP